MIQLIYLTACFYELTRVNISWQKLAEKSTGNMFFSPFSIMTALGMAYAGASGKTEEEMRLTMQLTQDKEAVHTAFQDVVSDLKVAI